MSQAVAGIILAAGKGTRMKSDLPKGLHEVLGVPMVELVARAMKEAGVERPIIVIGHGGEKIQERLGDGYQYAWQHEQKGTGHAAAMAAHLLEGFSGSVLVAAGDTPLVNGEMIGELVQRHRELRARCTLATSIVDEPGSYGRILRDERGIVCGIVEAKDASTEQFAIREVNAALYCFDAETLRELLPDLKNDNQQGEFYLTDAVAWIYKSFGAVEAVQVADPGILMGVNDRVQLAEAEKLLRHKVNRKHMLSGVTILDPEQTYIGIDVEIGPDTVIEPNTFLVGSTKIGSGCEIGPNTKIKRSTIGNGCYIYLSHLNEATIEDGVKVGPFANIRPGTHLKSGVKIGNFVEIKNSTMGVGSAANHLTYIGDSSVGAKTNVGAGTITCNYDGFAKHRTTIGNDVFVGSNSTLVAPVTIEDGAMIAAGSVVTHNVPADSLALGRSRQEVKEGWVSLWRTRKKSSSQ